MATYTGVLTGGQIEWAGGAKPPDGLVKVEALEPPPEISVEERRRLLREALESLAARGTLDPEEWERDRNECRRFSAESE